MSHEFLRIRHDFITCVKCCASFSDLHDFYNDINAPVLISPDGRQDVHNTHKYHVGSYSCDEYVIYRTTVE